MSDAYIVYLSRDWTDWEEPRPTGFRAAFFQQTERLRANAGSSFHIHDIVRYVFLEQNSGAVSANELLPSILRGYINRAFGLRELVGICGAGPQFYRRHFDPTFSYYGWAGLVRAKFGAKAQEEDIVPCVVAMTDGAPTIIWRLVNDLLLTSTDASLLYRDPPIICT
jgi:hypothetical protein